jgi:threonine synthase
MDELATSRQFTVDRETFGKIREAFVGDFVSNSESLQTIRRVFAETSYLMDPHTAVAWEVAERLRDDAPVLVVSTAHWAKFGTDVLKALLDVDYSESLPSEYESLTGVELLGKVRDVGGEGVGCVPRALAMLDRAEVRFDSVVDSGRESVENAVRDWLRA